MNYDNLRQKTIYDFTKDAKVIEELTAGMTKPEYLETLKENPVNNGLDLAELAEMTGNKELSAAVDKQYKDDFANYFNE